MIDILLAIDISETEHRKFYKIMKSEMNRIGQGQTIKITKS